MNIRPYKPEDRVLLAQLLQSTPEFSGDETDVALELADECAILGDETSYRALTAMDGDVLLGWACYGRTPMTESTFDLYWIVTSPLARGRGIGRALHAAVVDAVRAAGGERLRIETSTREGYGATLAFYDRLGYARVGTIPDFYAPGDDLVTGIIDTRA